MSETTAWQPIETAPKMAGEDVLLARFDEDGSYWYAVGQWWVSTWAFMYGDGQFPVLLAFEPTHWLPLNVLPGAPESTLPPPPEPTK